MCEESGKNVCVRQNAESKTNLEELRQSLSPVEKGKMLEKCVHYFIYNKMKQMDTPNPFNGYTDVMGRGIDNIIHLEDEKIAVECKNNAKTTYYGNEEIEKQFIEYFNPYNGDACIIFSMMKLNLTTLSLSQKVEVLKNKTFA